MGARHALLLGITCLCSCAGDPPPDAAGTGAVANDAFATMDQFQKFLIARSQTKFPDQPGFETYATDAEYPVGTLLKVGSTIPIDYDACKPASDPPAANAPNLFPGSKMTSSVGVDLGIDNSVLAPIVNAGITVNRTKNIDLKFEHVNVFLLSNAQIAAATAKITCIAAVRTGGPYWIVRGYIRGKRNFVLSTDSKNKAKFGVKGVASFDIDAGSGARTVTVSDTADVGFLQVVAEVSPTRMPPPNMPAPGGPEVTVSDIKPVAGPGRIYVQRDKADPTTNANMLVASFKAASLRVEPRVEAIDSAKMPRSPQVRYFNDADEGFAKDVLTKMQVQFPNAKLVHIKLPAPSQQLEVWLAKVG